MTREIKNMAASVRARLDNLAKSEGRPFDEVLQYYAMERFLHRLSLSEFADGFVLKGAMMIRAWGGSTTRSTRDIDLLGQKSSTVEELVEVVRSCIKLAVDDDGLRFDPDSIAGEEVRLTAHYDGIRVHCFAYLDRAKVKIQVDVGFGDVITPGAAILEYPAILDFAKPQLQCYTPETVIAEKLEAMVTLDVANTRLKDFFDVWSLSQSRPFSGPILSHAIRATFERRRTDLPENTPIALTSTFYARADKKAQWKAFLKKTKVRGTVPPLNDVAAAIAAFVNPVLSALATGDTFRGEWPAGGPWAP